MKKVLALFAVLLFSTALFSGCIEEKPVFSKYYLIEIEVTDDELATSLGMEADEIANIRETLNVKTYTVDPYLSLDINAYQIFEDYYLDYSYWVEMANQTVIDHPYITVYAGAWRKLLSVNSVIVSEGVFVEDEIGHTILVITAHGDFDDFEDML